MPGTVLLVDDQARPRRALAAELEDAGFAVVQAADGDEAWREFCRSTPGVVLTDMVMPRSGGLELLARIRSRSDVPVILFTARGSVEAAASAFKTGADDFVSSPDVEVEDLIELVANAMGGSRSSPGLPGLEDRLVGKSRTISRIRERVSGLAPLRTPVLVAGPPGTGRDTVVRALHELGSTAGGELVRIEPGMLPPEGRVLRAAAVYLDGVERFSPEAQSQWAHRITLAEAEGFRTGPRILASTTEVRSSDLHDGGVYPELRDVLLRFSIELPPLGARMEDLPHIADALVEKIGASVGRRIRLSPAACEFLRRQRWPGNIRQLEQLLERATAFSRGRQIPRGVVQDLMAELESSLTSIREQHNAAERDALLRALQEAGGNVTHAADLLGRSRSAVYRLLRKHGVALVRPS